MPPKLCECGPIYIRTYVRPTYQVPGMIYALVPRTRYTCINQNQRRSQRCGPMGRMITHLRCLFPAIFDAMQTIAPTTVHWGMRLPGVLVRVFSVARGVQTHRWSFVNGDRLVTGALVLRFYVFTCTTTINIKIVPYVINRSFGVPSIYIPVCHTAPLCLPVHRYPAWSTLSCCSSYARQTIHILSCILVYN